jgi:hypothetical protein
VKSPTHRVFQFHVRCVKAVKRRHWPSRSSGLGASTGFEPPVREPFPNPSTGSSSGFLRPGHDSGPLGGKHEYAVHTIGQRHIVEGPTITLRSYKRRVATPARMTFQERAQLLPHSLRQDHRTTFRSLRLMCAKFDLASDVAVLCRNIGDRQRSDLSDAQPTVNGQHKCEAIPLSMSCRFDDSKYSSNFGLIEHRCLSVTRSCPEQMSAIVTYIQVLRVQG